VNANIIYTQLTPKHFNAVLALANFVHGDNYLNEGSLQTIYKHSWLNEVNCSWVAIDPQSQCNNSENNQRDSRQLPSGYLVGFRLTLAPQTWPIDKWCSAHLWPYPADDVCYFKCNTVDANMRGKGIGKALLLKSIESAKQQGAKAGLAHIWLASPNNSAFAYFSACGGKLIKEHPNKWQIHSIEDNYQCPVCFTICTCTGAEMLLAFDNGLPANPINIENSASQGRV
jgi:ribosomal protein S18 acetylase RimI-like enzyme